MLKSARAGQAMRTALNGAADEKIVRIVSMLDDAVDPTANQVILDPLRGRLAMLRPARPLRFNRLLFMPLDPIIVPPRNWRPDQAVIPRTILTALSHAVRQSPGFDLAAIEGGIAGCNTDAVQAITRAGGTLWPLAAGVLADAPMPPLWLETGLPAPFYRPLADAVAAVLRRASCLRQLQREGEVGALEPDEAIVGSLLVDLSGETPDTCTMIMRLILAQAPAAIMTLRRCIGCTLVLKDRAMLQQSIVRATGYMLDDMEHGNAIARPIATGSAGGVADHVRRIVALLAVMQSEAGRRGAAVATGPRLRAIRDRLDQACQARVAHELEQGLLGPIGAAQTPVEGSTQGRFEACLRDLRAIETAARPIGGAAVYDALLQRAADAVTAAAQAGVFSPMRQIRLIELLQGMEAAHALYRTRFQTVPA